MHNAAIAHLGVDYVYLPLPVKPEDLGVAIAGFAAIGLEGFSITIPHKQAIMPLLSEMTEIATAIGAVNTVYRTAQGWGGTNTDVVGFVAPLRSQSWQGATALVLGNGGAARAVVVGCAQLGFAQIQVVGRDPDKLQAFSQSWSQAPFPIPLTVHSWEDLPLLLPQANLLVNTTPVGMAPKGDRAPLSLGEMERLPEDAIAYDLIYTPRPTLFLQQAQQLRLGAIDGVEMLVQQGAEALAQWLQQPVPVEVMRTALLNHLNH